MRTLGEIMNNQLTLRNPCKGDIMTKAPNETEAQYTRKNELFAIQKTRELTSQELYELRDLTRNAISHLTFTTCTIKKS